MARPMKPIASGADAELRRFAEALRALHEQAGKPKLAEMAQHCGVSPSSLSNAHSGRVRPPWRSVCGYVSACGGDPADWRSWWDSLDARHPREYEELRKRWEKTGRICPPRHLPSEAELPSLLHAIRSSCGLSLRELSGRSPGYSHHVYGEVLRGKREVNAAFLEAFLHACEVDLKSLERWLRLLVRVRPQEKIAVERRVAALLSPATRSRTALTSAVDELERHVGAFRASSRFAKGSRLVALRGATVKVLTSLKAAMAGSGEQDVWMLGYLADTVRAKDCSRSREFFQHLMESGSFSRAAERSLPGSLNIFRVRTVIEHSLALVAFEEQRTPEQQSAVA